MPRLKAENIKQLAEPIIIEAGVLNDREYIIEKITTELMNKVTDLAKDKDDIHAPAKQLALLVDVKPDEFKNVDIRKIGKVLEFIVDTVKEGLESSRNFSKAEAKS